MKHTRFSLYLYLNSTQQCIVLLQSGNTQHAHLFLHCRNNNALWIQSGCQRERVLNGMIQSVIVLSEGTTFWSLLTLWVCCHDSWRNEHVSSNIRRLYHSVCRSWVMRSEVQLKLTVNTQTTGSLIMHECCYQSKEKRLTISGQSFFVLLIVHTRSCYKIRYWLQSSSTRSDQRPHFRLRFW